MTVVRVIAADPCADNRESLAELLQLYGFACGRHPQMPSSPRALATRPSWAIHDDAPGVPVAFHTTRGQPADVRLAKALGCPHFLKGAGTADLLKWLGGWAVVTECGDDGGRGDYPVEFVSGPCHPRRRARLDYGRRLRRAAVAPTGV